MRSRRFQHLVLFASVVLPNFACQADADADPDAAGGGAIDARMTLDAAPEDDGGEGRVHDASIGEAEAGGACPDDPACRQDAQPDAGVASDAGVTTDGQIPTDGLESPTDGGEGMCPADLFAALGMACSPEGAFCGGEDCDPCNFCNVINCSGGVWVGLEAFPLPPDDPRCQPDAAISPADAGAPVDAAAAADASTCPADIFAAIGTACEPENAFCGGEHCGPCGFCNLIRCVGGVWERLEAPPPPPDDPACQPDAAVPPG